MTSKTLEELKNELKSLNEKICEKKQASKQKDKKSIEKEIQIIANNMVSHYKLRNYSKAIRLEGPYEMDFFIFNVESIIRDEKSKN